MAFLHQQGAEDALEALDLHDAVHVSHRDGGALLIQEVQDFLFVLADKGNRPTTYIHDGSLVLGNMMNEAESLGVATCWIHRAKEVFESDEGKALLASWGITGDYEGIGNLAVGFADAPKNAPAPRKENYIYYVK